MSIWGQDFLTTLLPNGSFVLSFKGMMDVNKGMRGFVLVVIMLCFSLLGHSQQGEMQLSIKNFHSVDGQVYRSAQPSAKGFKQAEKAGLKTVLSLRKMKFDQRRIKKQSNLHILHFPLETKTIAYQDLLTAMVLIDEAQKPLLVHCRRGIDRTGIVVATYRMLKHSWTKEKAIEEFLSPEFGYSEKLFPNVLQLLRSVNPNQLKKDFEERKAN
jgi:protein tyrosine/serine phosphatase